MTVSIDNIVGFAAGVFTGISMLPQLIKIIKEKKAEEVSSFMITILLTGLALWVYYGILKSEWPIIITNAFSFLVSSLVLVFKLHYRKK